MFTVQLTNIPNQEFAVNVGASSVNFRIHYFRELLYCDATVDGIVVSCGVKCVPNGWLMPKYGQDVLGGNFRFETDNEAYPDSDRFEDGTCRLVFYSQEEMNAL